ncbi:MAG: bifunctional metallophosphatase/5'-nucleotidase [Planctomycetes bacterium]|nr:bifunctional metallophosphatase/5'-nucleotidase [Planctomycetota bacterium]
MSQRREGPGSWCGLLLVALFGVPLAISLGISTEATAPLPTRWAEQRITILHTNDLHGQVRPRESGPRSERGGLLALGRTIRAEREAALLEERPVLLLDAGDFFQGTLEGDRSRGAVVVDWMNELRYDAVTVGNHEFDFGIEVMSELGVKAKFPFLGANIRSEATGQVPSWLGTRKGDPLDGSALIRQMGALRVAVIGLTTSQMKRLTREGATDGLTFQEEAKALEHVLERVGDADLRIVLTHCGLETDRALAKRFQSQIDVIVGGHSHTRLETGEHVGRVLIVQAWKQSRALGRVELRVTAAPRAGERPRVEAVATLIGTNSGLEAVLAPHLAQIGPEANRVVAELGERGLSASIPRGASSSPLGNLVADAIGSAGEADIAFHNRYGTRGDLPAGKVLYRHLYEALPFHNRLVTLTLTGDQIKKLVAASLDGSSTPLEISGASVEFNPQNPVGQRLLGVRVGSRPLDPARKYRVATHDFLANGGDGHVGFRSATEREDHQLTLREVVERYLSTREGYVAPDDERWVRLASPQNSDGR